jgi:endonuclease YncB( thermonuclease family)
VISRAALSPAHACTLAAALLLFAAAITRAAEDAPYIGSWSNGRGETLVITEKTIRLRDGRALPYRDVTRATDGSTFELQISAKAAVNGFGGNTLGVECDGDSMKITAYASHAAYMQGGEPQSVVTWFKEESEDDEQEE